MTRTFEKIALGIFFVVLIGFNSFFILGQEKGTVVATDTESTAADIITTSPTKNIKVLQERDDDEESEDDEDLTMDQLRSINRKVSEEEAKAIALETIGSGTVIEVEAERENGRLIYGITIRTQGDTVEVEVDAQTGEVLEIEWGEDDEDD